MVRRDDPAGQRRQPRPAVGQKLLQHPGRQRRRVQARGTAWCAARLRGQLRAGRRFRRPPRPRPACRRHLARARPARRRLQLDRSRMVHDNYMYQAVLLPTSDKGQAELFKPYAVANTVYSDQQLEALASGPPLHHLVSLSLSLSLSHSSFEPSATPSNTLNPTGHFGIGELKYIGAWRRLFDATYADLGGGKGSLDFRLDSNAYAGRRRRLQRRADAAGDPRADADPVVARAAAERPRLRQLGPVHRRAILVPGKGA